MGICGADAATTRRVLDAMAAHVGTGAGRCCDRREVPAFGLLRFHHGVVEPAPQTVAGEDERLLIAADGEVFERGRLRADLESAGHRFRHPESSAELLLHLYEQHGDRAFRIANGSFSAAIYDLRERRLLLVTDPFFSRPIFYCRLGDALVFSSRFNCLVACGALDGGSLDVTAVMQMFTFQHCQYTNTHYSEAKAMPAAGVLEFRNGELAVRKYWRLQYEALDCSEDEFAEGLADGFRHSAAARTSGRARKGVLLSGGLDARALVAASEAPMRSYTVADWFNREARIARRIARVKGWRHEFLRRSPGHYTAILDQAVELAGGMARFDSCHFLGQFDGIGNECDVLFVEELMDALFKGVYWASMKPVRGLRIPWPHQKHHTFGGIEEQILRIDCKSTFPSHPWTFFREPWRKRYREIMYATIREQMDDADADDPNDVVAHVGGFVSPGRVEAFMNLTCLRPYTEYRSMCLDRRLLELSTAMPVAFRRGGRVFKKALKLLDPQLWSIPYANTGVRVDAPPLLAWAAQLLGEVPLAALRTCRLVPRTTTNESWPERGELLRTPPFREMLNAMLNDEEAIPPDLFDLGRLRQLVAEHMSHRRRHVRALMCLITFGHWFKRFGPGGL